MIAWVGILVGAVVGAGFDCSKAAHPVEVRICSDSILSRLDDSLSVSWKATLAAFGKTHHQALRREQKDWNTELRREAPEVSKLQAAWRHRLQELALKRSTVDLRRLVASPATMGTVRLENWGSCGRMDFETGEPVSYSATDQLELSIVPGTDRIRFELSAGNDQPQCHSCSVDAELPAGSGVLRQWSTGAGEDKATGMLSIAADSIVLEIRDHNQAYQCGIGAYLGPRYTFHRSGLRLPPP